MNIYYLNLTLYGNKILSVKKENSFIFEKFKLIKDDSVVKAFNGAKNRSYSIDVCIQKETIAIIYYNDLF